MNNRGINIVLVIVAVTLLMLLAFRVSFEQLPVSGCCSGQGKGFVVNNKQ